MLQRLQPFSSLALALLVAGCGSDSDSASTTASAQNQQSSSGTLGSSSDAGLGTTTSGGNVTTTSATASSSDTSGGAGGAGSAGSSNSTAAGVEGASSVSGSTATGAGGTGSVTDVCPSLAQACYYVSAGGSDEATGSVDAPFQTLTRARDVVRGVRTDMTGDIHVYLRGGDYRITSTIVFGPDDSGTNDHRIHYEAYPGEKPVLNGSTQVAGWAQHEGDIYSAPLERSTKLRNLYVNDARAFMASKSVQSNGGHGTFSVTQGEASWAWESGSGSDGVRYSAADIPEIATNQDDLEIINGTTWNENIVTVRAVETSDDNRVLLLQQPYGAIAQLPGWNSGFSVTGRHIVVNAYAFLDEPGEFFFDKTAGTLYYMPRAGQDMATAEVEVPFVEKLLEVAGTSRTDRVRNLTFRGITFAHTDYNLYQVENSRGKATVQGSTIWTAYGTGDWHAFRYEINDTPPAMINVDSAESIEFISNVVKHSGSEGIAMHNDVVDSSIIGNHVTDTAGSGITIGHPQHIYLGDGGTHAKYTPEVEGICTNITIDNNLVHNVSTVPGFGGHSGVLAFFVDSVRITHNYIHTTGYNGVSLGWGWRNFKDSTTCQNNVVSYNRFNNIMARLHDSGAVYTIGQMPGTQIHQNYVKGIPPATSGPTYGLHNDEGTAYIEENDNVLDIDPGVKYTINCEDFGEKHDLTILRTYATVNKMGIDPPNSQIDTPIVVADAVWPVTQYGYALHSGIEEEHRSIIPRELLSLEDYVFPASCEAPRATMLDIRSSGDPANAVWFAPADSINFVEGAEMTRAAGDATSIAVPAAPGSYKLFVLDATGQKLGESAALLRVVGE
ncbi:MAG TPA: right-handed parallel beta-helix repeat-containing protein [Polyangiaceae bacterium]